MSQAKKTIERLEARLSEATTERERIDLQNELALHLLYSDRARSHTVAEEAGAHAREANYPPGIADSLRNHALYYIIQAEFTSAVPLCMEALAIYEKIGDQRRIGLGYGTFGLLYLYLGMDVEALDALLRAAQLLQESGAEEWLSVVTNNIGYLYLNRNEPHQALPYLQESLRLAEADANQRNQAHALDNLCAVHLALGDDEGALAYGGRSVQLYHNDEAWGGEAEALTTLGNVHRARGEWEAARDQYHRALVLTQMLSHPREKARILHHIGELSRDEGKEEEALHFFQQALVAAEGASDRKEIAANHHALAQLHKARGEFEHALAHFEQFHTINAQIFNHTADQRMKTLEVLHQVERAHQETALYRIKSEALQREIDERKKVEAALQQIAMHDGLTGLLNRHHFMLQAERELARSLRYDHPLAMVLLDADHFKRINDGYGHLAGDHVLIALAEHIRQATREHDVAGRYGGEEFAILLPETSANEALRLAERLRVRIAATPIVTPTDTVHIRVSIGVAEAVGGGSGSLNALLDRADRALYEAKRAGRNRTALFYPL